MFYGPDKIANITDDGETHKVVTLENGKSVRLTTIMAAETITEAPIDATELRSKRCYPVVKEVLESMLRWDIHMDEASFVLNRVKLSLENSHEQALNVLLGVETTGAENMSKIDEILKGKVNPDAVHLDEGQQPAAEETPASQ